VVIALGQPRPLGRDGARLRFGESEKAEGAWAGARVLQLDGHDAFELSLWCGTCPFLFKRLEGANDRLSLEAMQDRLAEGIAGLDDDVITTFGALLPPATYLPMLLAIRPRLITPSHSGDYFAEEQVATWGVDAFWGLPEYPHTPYYRTFETRAAEDAHLYEFVVPMVPPSWNQAETVAAHRLRLELSSTPTAVAVTILDVCAPAVDDKSSDWYWHWGLSHFLLDGHHKLQAAAETGAQLQLLSLLSIDASQADADNVTAIPTLRDQRAQPRTDQTHG
jgi:hypothetical protein